VVRREREIGLMMFFREHLDCSEVRGEAGAMQLVGLLGLISLCDQDEAMAGGEFAEGGCHVG